MTVFFFKRREAKSKFGKFETGNIYEEAYRVFNVSSNLGIDLQPPLFEF